MPSESKCPSKLPATTKKKKKKVQFPYPQTNGVIVVITMPALHKYQQQQQHQHQQGALAPATTPADQPRHSNKTTRVSFGSRQGKVGRGCGGG
jgi:hypothetical protein